MNHPWTNQIFPGSPKKMHAGAEGQQTGQVAVHQSGGRDDAPGPWAKRCRWPSPKRYHASAGISTDIAVVDGPLLFKIGSCHNCVLVYQRVSCQKISASQLSKLLCSSKILRRVLDTWYILYGYDIKTLSKKSWKHIQVRPFREGTSIFLKHVSTLSYPIWISHKFPWISHDLPINFPKKCLMETRLTTQKSPSDTPSKICRARRKNTSNS